MDLHKNLFANSDLTPSVRFITALKITAKKYCNNNFNATAILFGIMGDYHNVNKALTGYKRNAVADIAFSEEKCHHLRSFILEIYNDDQLLLDFLNDKITLRSISINKVKARDKDEVINITKDIINTNLLANLDLKF